MVSGVANYPSVNTTHTYYALTHALSCTHTHTHTGNLQLMFQVNGEHSSAMVSMGVRRAALWSRRLQFTSLAVDLPSGERLLLKGPSSSVVFQGYTKLR